MKTKTRQRSRSGPSLGPTLAYGSETSKGAGRQAFPFDLARATLPRIDLAGPSFSSVIGTSRLEHNNHLGKTVANFKLCLDQRHLYEKETSQNPCRFCDPYYLCSQQRKA
jgi:hypothetical protein